MILFAVGFIVGGIVGIFTLCLCQAAGRADDTTNER